MTRWRFAVDRGGTFTDVIGIDPHTGQQHVLKVLSSDHAPLHGIRRILGLAPDAPIPPCELRLGTTLATNALLERRGVPCALLITRGFGDLLEIGTQARPDIFALQIQKPQALYTHVLEVDARCDMQGNVVARPSEACVTPALQELLESGVRSVAIVVMHSYANSELELELAQWARQVGFNYVACSHEVAPELGLLRRADSTVLDAYLTPLVRNYLRELAEHLPGSELLVMQSSGALCAPDAVRGAASLLSGPAGGILGYAAVARDAGASSAVGFDMGGTSTDVSRVEQHLPRVYETTLANVRVLTPMLDIQTVAAGGGSLCTFDGHALQVGPHSAGANPGPACYGNPQATALTITDVNLLLGRLQADLFPFALDVNAAQRASDALFAQLARAGSTLTPDQLLAGLLTICNNNMAQAIARVSLQRGYDVRQDVLVVYGGAGGQHACAVARLLGIQRLLVPRLAGVLSAFGISTAELGEHGTLQLLDCELCAENLGAIERDFSHLSAEVARRLPLHHAASTRITCSVDLRYRGNDNSITVVYAADRTRQDFETHHQRLYGYVREQHPVEAVTLRVAVAVAGQAPAPTPRAPALPASAAPPHPLKTTRIYCDRWYDAVPVFTREQLRPGHRLQGPACVLDNTGTLLIDPGFELRCVNPELLELRDTQVQQQAAAASSERAGKDPVLLEILGQAFMSIAEQMGEVLRRTALSTNIRERLDFSCAVFDDKAQLIANAPHIPVHLGAMSESVAHIARCFPEPQPGQVFVTNDPAFGGSHLPDITVVTPVFLGQRVAYFVANRGHHADVGGHTPGSMPPFSTDLRQEGVVLHALTLVSDGQLQREALLQALTSGPYPARYPAQNLADLEAQVAANHLGAQLLSNLIQLHSPERLTRYVGYLYDYAAARVAALRERLGHADYRMCETLDDGTPLGVTLRVRPTGLQVVFDATPEHAGNANTPRAVVLSAVLYVLRCLVGSGLPLNAGCQRDLELVTPAATLLNPGPERAVCSGNVETSQRIVDLLLGALGVLAASQGTMNNLSFGNEQFAYYETLGGGSGAGASFAGANAVQVHMTNTRITDAEVLESRYPVRLLRFSVRPNSGGRGRFPGGHGLIREFEFLQQVTVSLVGERRLVAAFGLQGGGPGACGVNLVNGSSVPGRYRWEAMPGDVLRLETPGGGGWGAT